MLIILAVIFTQTIADDDAAVAVALCGFYVALPPAIIFIISSATNSKHSKDDEYIKNKNVEKYLINNNIPRDFWNLEYDETIVNYKVTNRYQYKNLLIDYNDDENSIRIFNNNTLSKPIPLSSIIEYDLLDENRTVCSCKKGENSSTRKVIYNSFGCDNLVFQFQAVDRQEHIITDSYTILAGADRDSAKFKKAIDFLTIIFNQMDALLIDKSAKTNEQAVDNDTDDSTYEKLLQLKKLLDEGIIDQVTYEEKKKKLVDKL